MTPLISRSGRPAAPNQPRSVRLTAVALAVAVPLGLVLLNLAMGQDANWDLRNYHWYNPYSFLNGRFFFDVVPAQTPSFYNPTLDVPFFLLGNAVPAPVAYSVLALVQALNFVLLFALAHAVLRIDRPLVKVWAAAAIALVGVAGGGNLSQIGTTFHDNTVSLGVYRRDAAGGAPVGPDHSRPGIVGPRDGIPGGVAGRHAPWG